MPLIGGLYRQRGARGFGMMREHSPRAGVPQTRRLPSHSNPRGGKAALVGLTSCGVYRHSGTGWIGWRGQFLVRRLLDDATTS